LLVAALASLIAGCAAPPPLKLSESFTDPHAHAPPPQKKNAAGRPCVLVVDRITDARSDPRVLGSVAGRAVHAPADVNAWLRNVLGGFGGRGVQLVYDAIPSGEARPLVGSLTLKIAWVSELHTDKNATTLWHLQLRRGASTVLDQDFRGADTAMNWSSGDGELQRMVDRAFGASLDQMAAEVRGACGLSS
jgi:hypothetical protein